MPRMSSYQRRKRDIAYLEQTEKELCKIVMSLVGQLKNCGIEPKFRLGYGISGDNFLTPYNMGIWPDPIDVENA